MNRSNQLAVCISHCKSFFNIRREGAVTLAVILVTNLNHCHRNTGSSFFKELLK